MAGSLILFAITGSITYVLYLMFESAADFSKGPIGLFLVISGLVFLGSIYFLLKTMFYRSIGITEEKFEIADEQFKRKLSPEMLSFFAFIKKPRVIFTTAIIIGIILVSQNEPPPAAAGVKTFSHYQDIGALMIFGGIVCLFKFGWRKKKDN